MKKRFMLVFALIFAVGFSMSPRNKMRKTQITLALKDGTQKNLSVELAITSEQQARGFMERKNIPEGTGMLFVFEQDKIASFWMKNTPTALSIAFINSDGTIRDIFDMKPFSEKSVASTGYVRYALEVPQGWFAKNGIRTGDKMALQNF